MSVLAKVMGPHKVGLRRRTPKHGARGPPSETSSKQRATRNPAGGSEEGTEGPRKPQLGPRELAPTHGVTLMDSCLTAHGEFNNCKLQRPSCSLARRAARLPCQRRHHSPAENEKYTASARHTNTHFQNKLELLTKGRAVRRCARPGGSKDNQERGGCTGGNLGEPLHREWQHRRGEALIRRGTAARRRTQAARGKASGGSAAKGSATWPAVRSTVTSRVRKVSGAVRRAGGRGGARVLRRAARSLGRRQRRVGRQAHGRALR